MSFQINRQIDDVCYVRDYKTDSLIYVLFEKKIKVIIEETMNK